LGQEWASMTYIFVEEEPETFMGFFKSTAVEDFVLGSDCIENQCRYKMSPAEYIKAMEILGWEISEHIEAQDKKGQSIIWFRRYQ
jgi:hypothetical protein